MERVSAVSSSMTSGIYDQGGGQGQYLSLFFNQKKV